MADITFMAFISLEAIKIAAMAFLWACAAVVFIFLSFVFAIGLMRGFKNGDLE